MKVIAKLAMGAAMLAGLALTAAPADAGVAVGINIGGHPHARSWCWHHPRACHGPAVVVGPRLGVYYHGRGWWDGRRYWGHRYWYHRGWRYR
ncbi:MAG: hypothetical protein WDM89_07835 [Rhizomicrobium sp.]